MASNSLKAVRRDRRSNGVVWALAGAVVILAVVIGYLVLSSDLFADEPTTDLERDYQMLLSGLDENAENSALLMTLAEVEYELGKTDEAFDHAEQAIEYSEGNPGMHIRFAALLLRDGDLERARAEAQAEIDAGDDKNAEPYFVLAQIDRESGDVEAAIVNVERGLELDPVAADMMIVYGGLLEEAGRTDEAITQYERAYRFLPDNPQLVETLRRLGVSAEASETPVSPHGDSQ